MFRISNHALERCRTRRIPELALHAALEFGRTRTTRGAIVHTLGWRQVRDLAERGLDLARYEGVEVVEAHDGVIVTVYRNTNRRAMRGRGRVGRRGHRTYPRTSAHR